MRAGGKYLVLLIVLCTSALLQAETYHGIDFSCTVVPQSNLLGVTMASNVQTTATNVSHEKVFFRYSVTVTGSRGTVSVLGGGLHADLGQGNFAPTAKDGHTFEALFSRVGVQDEFPKTCQFLNIQVCPATPPAGFPKGNYFRPFLDGKCSEIGKTRVITFADKVATSGSAGTGDCAAVLYGDTGRASAYGYGAGWNAATVEDATNTAHAQMDKKGIVYGDPHKYQGVVFEGCGVPHGAVAGARDDQLPNDQDFVVLTLVFGKGASQSEAESNAVASCRSMPNSRGKTCEVTDSW